MDRASMRSRLREGLYFANFALWLYLAPLTRWPDAPERHELLRWVKRCASWSLAIFDLPLEVRGRAHLRGLDQAIYIANHRSWLDQPVVILAADHLLHFLGKAAYFEMPLLGRVLRTYGCLPVHRERPAALLEAMRARLDEGGSLLVYPEATRAQTSELLPFRSGAFALSALSGVPIVPLYVYGTAEALPRARPFRELRRHPLRVDIGEPFVVGREFLTHRDTEVFREAFRLAWQEGAP